ncbi:zinc finger swim domain-containing protein 7-like [Moniliophthora roreri]|nr:zinc finger swim domain-containing protein 7-like [Moniliophthora roreri]
MRVLAHETHREPVQNEKGISWPSSGGGRSERLSVKLVKNVSPWGHTNYEVSGSTATYTVHVNLSVTPLSSYCNCPTFVYAVLKSGSHAMCKHVLATRLAIKLNLCVEGSHSVDALASHAVLRHGGSR